MEDKRDERPEIEPEAAPEEEIKAEKPAPEAAPKEEIRAEEPAPEQGSPDAPEDEPETPDPEIAPRRRSPASKKRARKLAGIILLCYLAVLAVAALLLDGRHALVILNGPEEMSVEVGTDFIDPGARAVSDGRIFGRSRRPLALDADNLIDTSRLGDVTVRSSASVLGRTTTAERLVHVVDTTPPVITLVPAGALTSWFKGFEEPGYSASDNYDGDISDRVVRTELRDKVNAALDDLVKDGTYAEIGAKYPEIEPFLCLGK